MELKIIQDNEKELWDSAVLQCGGSTIFHTWKWLKLVELHSKKKVMGRKYSPNLHALMVSENGSVIGIFPVFLYPIPFFRLVTSPPLGVENLYLGPLLSDMGNLSNGKKERRFIDFFKIIHDYIENTLRPDMILIHSAPESMHDMRPLKWAGYDVEPQYTYEVDLTAGKTNIWNGFPKAVRYSITKAKRIGISVEDGSINDLIFIYERLLERDHIHPEKQFLYDIYKNFHPEHLKIFIAKREGQPVSGIVALIHQEKVMFWIGAARCSIEGISPNELVMWECMTWASEKGYKFFELMGADDVSLFQFKGKFNGKLKIYFTIRRFSAIPKICECLYRAIKPRYSS